MNWFDRLDEMQSEMYAKAYDYAVLNPNNPYVKFDENNNLVFHTDNGTMNELDSAFDIWELANILDNLEL